MAGIDVSFDFVRDDELRASLRSDYAELQACAEERAWKAVHVLAGSVIEAVLADYLIGAGRSTPSPVEMTLAQLISTCRKAKAISETTSQLSNALKSYRNLIHPGRAKRLNEAVDEDTAVVAQALVSMIVREVAVKQEQTYGFTAEQMINKFRNDPSALGIAEHLLRDAPDLELERLLLQVLPRQYFEELDEPGTDVLASYRDLFRAALARASIAVKKKVMARYVAVLRIEPGRQVKIYEEEFFVAHDLDYVEKKDRELVKAHLLSRLKESPTLELVRAAEGIGFHLVESDVEAFVDALVRLVVYGDSDVASAARERLAGEAWHTESSVDKAILSRMADWVRMFDSRSDTARAGLARELRELYSFAEPPSEDASGEGSEDEESGSS